MENSLYKFISYYIDSKYLYENKFAEFRKYLSPYTLSIPEEYINKSVILSHSFYSYAKNIQNSVVISPYYGDKKNSSNEYSNSNNNNSNSNYTNSSNSNNINNNSNSTSDKKLIKELSSGGGILNNKSNSNTINMNIINEFENIVEYLLFLSESYTNNLNKPNKSTKPQVFDIRKKNIRQLKQDYNIKTNNVIYYNYSSEENSTNKEFYMDDTTFNYEINEDFEFNRSEIKDVFYDGDSKFASFCISPKIIVNPICKKTSNSSISIIGSNNNVNVVNIMNVKDGINAGNVGNSGNTNSTNNNVTNENHTSNNYNSK